MQILILIAEGLKSEEVANDLCLSKRTIDYHLANTYTKLGATNRIQAIITASYMSLLPVGPTVVAPVAGPGSAQNGSPGPMDKIGPESTSSKDAHQTSSHE